MTVHTSENTELSELIGLASAEVTKNAISLAYRGARGCACGCIGTYSDKLATITRARNDILRLVADGKSAVPVSGKLVKPTLIMVAPGQYVSVEYQRENWQSSTRVVTIYTDGRTS